MKCQYTPYVFAIKNGYEYEYYQQGAVMGVMPLSRDKEQNVILELQGQTEFCGIFSCLTGDCDSLKVYFLPYSNKKNWNGPECNGHGVNTCRCWMCFKGVFPVSYCSSNIVQNIIGEMYMKFQLNVKRKGAWSIKTDSVLLKTGETFRDTIYY